MKTEPLIFSGVEATTLKKNELERVTRIGSI